MTDARRQTTRTFRSRPDASADENFRAYLDCFRRARTESTPGVTFAFDTALSHTMRSSFDFVVRETRTTVGTLLYAETSPHALAASAQAPVRSGAFVQAALVMKGAVHVTLNDTTVLAKSDTLIVKDPTTPFVWSAQETCEWFSFIVPSDYFAAHTNVPLRTFLSRVLTLEKPEGRLLRNVMMLTHRMLDSLDARDAADAVDGMLCFMRPLLMSDYRTRRTNALLSKHDRIRGDAINCMQKMLGRPDVTVRTIAEACGVSPRVLSAVFREVGDSPAARLLRLRLEHAKVYLTETHTKALSVSDVARYCGFRSSAHFSRAFKALFGVSPRTMKKKSVLESSN